MKIYIICCVPVQISYLGKPLFINALSQSDCRIFKSTISPEQIDETASFFACWYKFTKIKSWKVDQKVFGKNECGQSGLGTIKLAVSQEWNGGINWSFKSW